MTNSLLGRTDLVTTAEIEGKRELMLSAKGMAYLIGLPVEEVEAEFKNQLAIKPGNVRIPKLWRIKAQEIVARLGTDDWVELLTLLVAEREGTN